MIIPTNPFAVVEIDGRRYSSRDQGSPIMSVQIDLTTDKSSQATLVVKDLSFNFTDKHLTGDGMKSLEGRFWLGFGDEGNPGPAIYSGVLVRHHRARHGAATFTFHDKSTLMKRGKKSRFHKKTSDIGLMRKVVAEHNLLFNGPDRRDDGDVHDDLAQYALTDWEMVSEASLRQGLRHWVHGDTFFAKEAGHVGLSVAEIILGEDERVLDFDFNYKLPENRRGRPRRVRHQGRGRGGRLLTGSSDVSPRGFDEMTHRDLPSHTSSAFRRHAQGRKDRSREHAFDNTLSLIPYYPDGRRIGLRSTITVLGAGDFYSGLYLIDPLSFDFKPGSLYCTLHDVRDIK